VLDRVGDTPRGVADFEADVPEHVENLLDHFGDARIETAASFLDEKQHVDVAVWIQFAPSVTAAGHDREARWLAGKSRVALQRSIEQMPQNDIHEAGPLAANLASAFTGLVPKVQAVVLRFEEFLVELNQLAGIQLADRTELLLRLGEDFFAMSLNAGGNGGHGSSECFGR
jgi:hypothetical protein